VPLAIDEFPALFVAAACAEGETVLTGAEELRVKESDRIQVMADGLAALGVGARPTPDGIRIQGGRIGGGRIASHGDHRIAMSFAIAALRAGGAIAIDDCANVDTSFPGSRPGRAGRSRHHGGGLTLDRIVTIDGPSGSGKGTIARLLADRLGWHCLDSGALYRLVGVAADRAGVSFDDTAPWPPSRATCRRCSTATGSCWTART